MQATATERPDPRRPATAGGASDAPIWALGTAEAGRRLADGRLSPPALLEAVLARIDALDGHLHTYVHLAGDRARAEADVAATEIAAGRRRGPLHGIPFAVKDNYDAEGMPATAASRGRLGHVPARDADMVARLRAAGAILVGKLATWEYGTGNGAEYFDLPFPPARNPWDTARFTGGSSTGAGAAVAAGLAGFAMGSDTTGSVRLPAGLTGCVGFIPTPGLLSLAGVLPNCHSLDVPGPIAWTVEDATLVMDALTGGDRFSAACLATVAGMRVAVVRDPGPGMPAPDPAMAAAFEAGLDVLRRLGVTLEEVALPVPAAECLALTQMIGPAESAAIHEAELRERPESLGRALRDKLMAGSGVRAVDYITALRRRGEVAAAMDALMAPFDALVTFGTLHLAPRLGVEPEMTAATLDTMLTPFNLSAQPALVQCTGFSPEGLPTHWQIAARRHDDASAFRLAAAYEAATDWRARRPSPTAPPPAPAVAPLAGTPSDGIRARAAPMGLGRLGDADLARFEELEALAITRGASLRRPADKATPPAFGLQRPFDPPD